MTLPTGNNKNAELHPERFGKSYPEGIIENSPALHRRVSGRNEIRPEGTDERRGHGPDLHPSLRDKSLAAFTLIELMLVMALLLIVISVSFPSLQNFFRGRNLDSEARRFVSLTHYGQSRAVSEGVPMVLWMDVKQRTYGLQAQTGYLANDNKAIEYELDDGLQMEVSAPPATIILNQRTATAQMAGNLPAIRFTPDGFITETSPESIQFREGIDRQSAAIWITQNGNRLNYEIQASHR